MARTPSGASRGRPLVLKRRWWIGLVTVAAIGAAFTERGKVLPRPFGFVSSGTELAAYRERLATYASENSALPSGCVLLLGDSLTELFPLRTANGRRVVNRGISGDRVRDVAARLAVSALAAPCVDVGLLIGSNDLVRESASPSAVRDQIRVLLDRLGARGKRVLLHTLPPTRGDFLVALPRIRELNALLRAEPWPEGVRLVALDAVLADARGHLRDADTEDGLHLTAAGYLRWRELLGGSVVER